VIGCSKAVWSDSSLIWPPRRHHVKAPAAMAISVLLGKYHAIRHQAMFACYACCSICWRAKRPPLLPRQYSTPGASAGKPHMIGGLHHQTATQGAWTENGRGGERQFHAASVPAIHWLRFAWLQMATWMALSSGVRRRRNSSRLRAHQRSRKKPLL